MSSNLLFIVFFCVTFLGFAQDRDWEDIWVSSMEKTDKGYVLKKAVINMKDSKSGDKLKGKVTFVSEDGTYEAIYIEHHKAFVFDTLPDAKGTLLLTSDGFESQTYDVMLDKSKPHTFYLGKPGCSYTVKHNTLFPTISTTSYIVFLAGEKSFDSVMPILDSLGLIPPLDSNVFVGNYTVGTIPVFMDSRKNDRISIRIDDVDSTQQIRFLLLKNPLIERVESVMYGYPLGMANGEIIIRFSKGLSRTSIDEVFKQHSLKVVEREMAYVYRVSVTEKSIGSVHEIAKKLLREEKVDYVNIKVETEYVRPSPPIH